MSLTTQIIYRISTGNTAWQTRLTIDPKLGFIAPATGKAPPAWVHLSYSQCKGCPLSGDQSCPIAHNLSAIASRWRELASFDEVSVAVKIDNRATTTMKTTAQQVLSSIVGILMAATPACPATRFLKPMVIFHRPFASQDESVYRALANLALFYQRSPQELSFSQFCLAQYQQLHDVNLGLVNRIRSANPEDESLINALVNLDTFVKGIIYNVENDYPSLSDIGF